MKYPDNGIWEEPRLEDNCLAYKAVTDGTDEEFSLEIKDLEVFTNYCIRTYAKMKYEDKVYTSYSNSEVWSTLNYSAPEFNSVKVLDENVSEINYNLQGVLCKYTKKLEGIWIN